MKQKNNNEKSKKAKIVLEINKTDKFLTRFVRKIKEKIKITTIRNKKEDITTDPRNMTKIIREYHELLNFSKFDNFDETDIFLEI